MLEKVIVFLLPLVNKLLDDQVSLQNVYIRELVVSPLRRYTKNHRYHHHYHHHYHHRPREIRLYSRDTGAGASSSELISRAA